MTNTEERKDIKRKNRVYLTASTLHPCLKKQVYYRTCTRGRTFKVLCGCTKLKKDSKRVLKILFRFLISVRNLKGSSPGTGSVIYLVFTAQLDRQTSHNSSRVFHKIQECTSKYTTAEQCINIERCSTTQINKEKSKIEDKIHNSSL